MSATATTGHNPRMKTCLRRLRSSSAEEVALVIIVLVAAIGALVEFIHWIAHP